MNRSEAASVWRPVTLLLASVGALALSNNAPARDVFLTIGGGYNPTGNQVSIESNVLFQQRVVREKLGEQTEHLIYFADGQESAPDLQYEDKELIENCPPAERLMSIVLGSDSYLGIRYRDHQVADVQGPTDPQAIKRCLKKLGKELQAGDRLFIYVTAHGGAAESSGDYDDYDYEYDEAQEKWVANTQEQSPGRSQFPI